VFALMFNPNAAQANASADAAMDEDLRIKHEGKHLKAKAREEMVWTAVCLAYASC